MKSESNSSRSFWVTRAAWISMGVSAVVLVLKFVAYAQTGSISVLSDAIESIVNVISAGVALFALKHVAEPADVEHPYGHGKLEYFSSAFEGGLISFAALAIAFEAVFALLVGKAPISLDSGLIYVGIATFTNLVAGLFLLGVGRANRSEALRASGTHLLSDVITSVAVIVGLLLVQWTGIQWIDAALAILISFQLMWTGYKIVRSSAGALLDEMEPETLHNLTEAFSKARFESVIDIHNLRLIRSGHFHHADAHVVMPEFLTVEKSHNLAFDFEHKVKKLYSFDLEIAFHIDPCQQRYCQQCQVSECPIRKRKFEALVQWGTRHVIQGPMPVGETLGKSSHHHS